MALTKEAYIRYKLIDECIRSTRKPFPTMEELIDYCEKSIGKNFSVSTIQKDIKTLKEDEALGFLAPIKFSKNKNGYYYTDSNYSISKFALSEEELDAIVKVTDFLQYMVNDTTTDYYNDALKKLITSVNVSKDIQKDEPPAVLMSKKNQQRGISLFDFLLHTIKEKKVLSLIYYDYDEEEFYPIILHPYQLKEFNNSWYLVGLESKSKELVQYSLDTILDPKIVTLPYDGSLLKTMQFQNENMYGITPMEENVRTIDFAASPAMSNHLNGNPLHASQRIKIIEDSGFRVYTIQVIVTYELKEWFFAHSKQVHVLDMELYKTLVYEMSNTNYITEIQ